MRERVAKHAALYPLWHALKVGKDVVEVTVPSTTASNVSGELADPLRQGLGLPKQLSVGLLVSARVGGPTGQRSDKGKRPQPAVAACGTHGCDVMFR
jgi:hypothetical protein